MDFAEAMESIEGLAGIEVAATIWGLGEDPSCAATLGGVLSAQQHLDSVGVSDSGMVDTDGEAAVTFGIGDHWGNELSFWPSRFVSAERHAYDPGVTIITLDAKVVVHPNRPWID